MELWHEYEYNVEDTTHDTEGNEMMEITLFIKPVADRWDITEALSNFLDEGLKTGENK